MSPLLARLRAHLARRSPDGAASPSASRDADAPTGRTGAVEAIDVDEFASYHAQAMENYRPLAAPFHLYRQFIHAIEELERVRVLPMHRFVRDRDGSRRTIVFRHDVDADPGMALRCARFLASRGLPGSFYLLHTAQYYGVFRGSTFIRNPALRPLVRALIVCGCEIGLHNDALGAFLFSGVDGPAHVAGEIAWLRSQGAGVRGTVAHNSAPVYRAANSEIFAGRRLWPRDARSADGRALPLEVLDERALGLEYEGTLAIARDPAVPDEARAYCEAGPGGGVRSEAWMRTFLTGNPTCRWDVDMQVWPVGCGRWVVAGRSAAGGIFHWSVELDVVLDALRRLPDGARCMVVIHPEYFMAD